MCKEDGADVDSSRELMQSTIRCGYCDFSITGKMNEENLIKKWNKIKISNFVEEHFEYGVDLDCIDLYIEVWHEGNSNKELHEFLGFTKEEYAMWLINPDSLEEIIRNKEKKK